MINLSSLFQGVLLHPNGEIREASCFGRCEERGWPTSWRWLGNLSSSEPSLQQKQPHWGKLKILKIPSIHQSILNFTYLSHSIWILRVTNCSQNCFKKNSSTWNLSPIFSPPTDILNLTTKIFLKYFAKKQRNDPDRQPPAHPMIRQSNFRDVASESSCQSRNFDGSEKIGRESETAARPAQLFGGRPWPRHRYLAFLISWDAFKRIRVWFASVSVERRVLQIIRTSLTFPLWGAIYFRHGVTTVDCIWSGGGGGGGRRERGAHT